MSDERLSSCKSRQLIYFTDKKVMRQIHDSLEVPSWEKQKLDIVGSVSLPAKKNEMQKLGDKAR